MLHREIQLNYCTHTALFKQLDKDYNQRVVEYLENQKLGSEETINSKTR